MQPYGQVYQFVPAPKESCWGVAVDVRYYYGTLEQHERWLQLYQRINNLEVLP